MLLRPLTFTQAGLESLVERQASLARSDLFLNAMKKA